MPEILMIEEWDGLGSLGLVFYMIEGGIPFPAFFFEDFFQKQGSVSQNRIKSKTMEPVID